MIYHSNCTDGKVESGSKHGFSFMRLAKDFDVIQSILPNMFVQHPLRGVGAPEKMPIRTEVFISQVGFPCYNRELLRGNRGRQHLLC